MYPFDELCSEEDYPFAYLLGVLRKSPKKSLLNAEFFTQEFGWLHTMEDQGDSPKETISKVHLYKKFVTPSAPLTMTPSRSPFPFTFEILPKVIAHGRTEEKSASAFAIWEPELVSTGENQFLVGEEEVVSFTEYVSESDIDFDGNLDALHFFWLLQMTVERAQSMNRKVILAGCPGWSYKSAVKNPMPPHSRVRLLQAGYRYPERIPYAARRNNKPVPDDELSGDSTDSQIRHLG